MARKREYHMTSYLYPAYHRGDMGRLIRRAVPKLKKFRKKNPFDAIAFCGYSGASIAAILSWKMNIPMIAVRKKTSHDHNLVFGLSSVERYIIVDDFIDSGATIKRIVKRVKELRQMDYVNPFKADPKLVGVFCYAGSHYCQTLSYYGFAGQHLRDVPVSHL